MYTHVSKCKNEKMKERKKKIRRIKVQDQPRQKVIDTSHLNRQAGRGGLGGLGMRIVIQGQPCVRPYLKNN
jgi:hypothetical protein